MARFQGNIAEFKRYFGPFVRNIVQQVSKRHKIAIKACEHCGCVYSLEAAHRNGFGRNDIIQNILDEPNAETEVDIDLSEFEKKFKEAHAPIENVILILCNECHRKYDAQQPAEGMLGFAQASVTDAKLSGEEVLPISLEPASHEEFKTLLLSSRRAIIEVIYSDGSIKQRSWDARKFSETSNVYGNLRSRPEFRKGNWQELGISKVNVRITE